MSGHKHEKGWRGEKQMMMNTGASKLFCLFLGSCTKGSNSFKGWSESQIVVG